MDLLAGQLRRDMMLGTASNPNGPRLMCMGLLVPVEVLSVWRLKKMDGWGIRVLVACSGGEERSLTTAVDNELTDTDCDVLHALAPALATFLHAHGIGPGQALATRLTRRDRRPVIPPRVLAPATADLTVHVGRRLAAARSAMLRYKVPVSTLDDLKMQDGVTLEEWVQREARGVDTLAAKVRLVHDRYHLLVEAAEELVEAARASGLATPL